MLFHKLGDPSQTATFRQAVLQGVPEGGGLYVPSRIPSLSRREIDDLRGKKPADIAFGVLWPWLRDEMSKQNLLDIIARAALFPIPVRQVGDKYVLELFHGPTAAFKDVAARFLAAFLGFYGRSDGRTITIIVATSGDTGGAIAQAFANIPGVRVIVLWPKGHVSGVQCKQLVCVAPNIVSFEIDGPFDSCLALADKLLADPFFDGAGLTTANSISVGRLLPQIIYYAVASLGITSLQPDMPLRFVVPSGNLGNLTAGVLAWSMGLPIGRFLAANNRNNLFDRYVTSGDREVLDTASTFSNAMDVGNPKNFARLHMLFAGQRSQLAHLIATQTVTDRQTVEAIRSVYAQNNGYLLDPHTAVAWHASETHPRRDCLDVIVSTAAPAKFAEEIRARTGLPVDSEAMMASLPNYPERYLSLPDDYRVVSAHVTEILSTGGMQ